MKLCKVCKIEKSESNFSKRENGKLRNECIDCKKSYLKSYRKGNVDNPFTQNTKNKKEKTCNTCGETKLIEEFIKSKRICKVCRSEYLKKYYEKNKESISEQSKLKYHENKEEKKESSRRYAKNNREKINLRSKKYRENVLYKDPLWSLKNRVSSRIRKSFKSIGLKKSTTTEKILGCTIDQFKNYIEELFMEGMNWKNREQWHIDHIIPISLAKNEEEIKLLNHYSNLRPMWSKDNIIKSNKVENENHPIYIRLLEVRNQDFLLP